jgi:hypothetical protein
MYSDFALERFTIYRLVNTLVISQYWILQIYFLVKSQTSISKELSKTLRIMRNFNLKINRQNEIELEILSLKILHRNLKGRTSSMFSLDYPILFEVSCKWIVQ